MDRDCLLTRRSGVFSVTANVERPAVWDDGNDYHDLDEDDLRSAHRNGYVEDWLRMGADDYEIAVAPLRVVVRLPLD